MLLILFAGLAATLPQRSFADLERGYAACEGAAERSALLDELVRAGAREELGDRRVAGALALGLADEDLDVRGHAAELVGALDPAEALRVLGRAVDDLGREQDETIEALGEVLEADPGEGLSAVSAQLAGALSASRKTEEALVRFGALRDRYALALAGIPGRRSLRLIEELSEQVAAGRALDGIVTALLTMGSADAVDTIVEIVKRLEDEIEDLEKAKAKLYHPKIPRPPAGVDRDRWEALCRGRADRQIEGIDERVADVRAWGGELAARLAGFAADHGLDAPPELPFPARAWKGWLRSNRDRLP